jgi:hypothetical protein
VTFSVSGFRFPGCFVRRRNLCRCKEIDNKKSVLNYQVQDASAALPQNCQTTKWILGPPSLAVNVTLVTQKSGRNHIKNDYGTLR